MTDLHDDAGVRDTRITSGRQPDDALRGGDAVAPLVFAAGVVKAVLALGAAIIAVIVPQAGRPDPIDIEPRILQRH